MTLRVPAGLDERDAVALYWSNFKDMVVDANGVGTLGMRRKCCWMAECIKDEDK